MVVLVKLAPIESQLHAMPVICTGSQAPLPPRGADVPVSFRIIAEFTPSVVE